MGITEAYAQHRFMVKGDIAEIMSIVRCIELAEVYLFPKIITKRIRVEYLVNNWEVFGYIAIYYWNFRIKTQVNFLSIHGGLSLCFV